MRLAGRRILVTGAASGIGLATAEVFRREGSAVALLDSNVEGLARTAADLRSEAGPPIADVAVDVADAASVNEAVESAAETLAGLDGIVCAAGIDLVQPFDAMSGEDWARIMAVNLTGPFNVCLAAVPHLKAAGGGTIVMIASGAALRPLADRTAYCTSKAGLVMLAKTLAVDLAPYSIRSNAVCPGIIDTPLFRASWEDAEDPRAELDKILDRYLIRRVGQPEDIANAALYLSSSESAQVTGTTLAVDGGRAFH